MSPVKTGLKLRTKIGHCMIVDADRLHSLKHSQTEYFNNNMIQLVGLELI